jgi:thymidylate synthase (FAD)
MVVNSARVSFGDNRDEITDGDVKLINYLAKHKHMSPFEHMGLTVKITCPLYIRSQIHRHRTFSYNEISRRYTSKDLEFYTPEDNDFRKQSKDNKQASEGAFKKNETGSFHAAFQHIHKECLDNYNKVISMGLCREQARGLLPQNLITEFYMTGNFRNWMHFIGLRDKKDAQKEVTIIAKDVRLLLERNFINSMEAFNNLDDA